METTSRYDVVVIGGGPAGSVAAMSIASAGFSVALLEKQSFPRETLCGEFLSGEVVRTISDLGLDDAFQALHPNLITTFSLFPASGRPVSAPLGFGAYGVKRSKFDSMLLEAARRAGVRILQPAEVKDVETTRTGYLLRYSSRGKKEICECPWVVGAFGKSPAPIRRHNGRSSATRTGLDGFKFHFPAGELNVGPRNAIVLAPGPGMYCGISYVGDDTVTLCVLEKRRKGDPGPRQKLKELIRTSPAFARVSPPPAMRLVDSMPIYGAGNLSFASRRAVRDGLLMVGDAAGMIAPLAGDGIGIAVEQGRLLGRLFVEAHPDVTRRRSFFETYNRESSRIFGRRRRIASVCQHMLLTQPLQSALSPLLTLVPGLLYAAIRGTRGTSGSPGSGWNWSSPPTAAET